MLTDVLSVILEFVLLGIVISFIVYFPEIFPKCSSCGKIKPRWCFKLHTHVSLCLGRKGNKSVCKKCCSKEEINSLYDLNTKKEIRKRVEYKTKYTL